MLWQCIIHHSTIFLFNYYATMEKTQNTLAKIVQDTIGIIVVAMVCTLLKLRVQWLPSL